MKEVDFLRRIIVILVLIGFMFCTISTFVSNFRILDESGNLPSDYEKLLNTALMYSTNFLTGLVGGIVAAAFGVKIKNPNDPNDNFNESKLSNLGNLISSTNPQLFGLLYALAYIAIGTTSIVIWIKLDDNAISLIFNMSITFLGMLSAIVIAFFSPQNLFYKIK